MSSISADRSDLPLQLRWAKPTPETSEIINVLINEYGMQRSDAIRLIAETGPLLVAAIKTRRKV